MSLHQRPGPATRTGLARPVRVAGRTSWRLTYVAPLDGLRAVAVGLVILVHCWPSRFPGGGVGVDVFFALSGFLITALLLNELTESGRLSLRRFYARRALRLLPVFLVFVLVVVLYSEITGQWRDSTLVTVPYVLLHVSNWFRASGQYIPLLGHTWSLSVEEQFYLVWPVLLLLSYRRWRLRGVLVAAVSGVLASTLVREYFLATGGSPERIYNGFDTRVYMLLAGCAAATALYVGWRPPARLVRATALLGTVVLLGATLLLPVRQLSMAGASSLLLALGIVGILYLLVLQPRCLPAQILAGPALVYVGRISYGIYLWHYPLTRIFQRYGYSEVKVLLLVVPLSFALASLSYVLVERPFLRLRKHFAAAPAPTPLDRQVSAAVIPEQRSPVRV